MGPSPTGDGERLAPSGPPASSSPCFNGAVANRRRRVGRLALLSLGRFLASMGPSPTGDGEQSFDSTSPASRMLQWGRRQQATERWPSAGCASCAGGGGFNGAVANRRRRAVVDEAATPDGPELQWGRRQQATESSDRHGGGQRSVVASMGPSPTGDGEGAGKIGNDLAEFCGHFRTGWVLRRDGGMSAMWAVWRVSVSSRVFVGFLLLVGLRAGPVRGRATGPLAATTSRVAIRISQSMRCQITTAWRSG